MFFEFQIRKDLFGVLNYFEWKGNLVQFSPIRCSKNCRFKTFFELLLLRDNRLLLRMSYY